MHKLMATLSAMVMVCGAGVATVAETAAPASPQAVYCVAPINPVVNYVVQTVCSKFGP